MKELETQAKKQLQQSDRMRTKELEPLKAKFLELTNGCQEGRSKLTIGALREEVKRLKKRVRELESSRAKLETHKSTILEINRDLKRNNRTMRRKNNRLKDALKKQETEVEEEQKHLFRQINNEEATSEIDDRTECTGSCSICWINELDTMISPCNHVCLCKDCASRVKEVCPICKGPIEERIPVFIS